MAHPKAAAPDQVQTTAPGSSALPRLRRDYVQDASRDEQCPAVSARAAAALQSLGASSLEASGPGQHYQRPRRSTAALLERRSPCAASAKMRFVGLLARRRSKRFRSSVVAADP